MLTIKHRERCGFESIVEAKSVSYQRTPCDGHPKAELLAFGVPDGTYPVTYVDGELFVMNEQGRTVARYNLDIDNAVAPLQQNEQAAQAA